MRKFKYQINHFLSIQPQHVTIEGLSIRLKQEYNIPPYEFDRDRRLREGEQNEIPQERLKVYAQLLDVSVLKLVEEDAGLYVLDRY